MNKEPPTIGRQAWGKKKKFLDPQNTGSKHSLLKTAFFFQIGSVYKGGSVTTVWLL